MRRLAIGQIGRRRKANLGACTNGQDTSSGHALSQSYLSPTSAKNPCHEKTNLASIATRNGIAPKTRIGWSRLKKNLALDSPPQTVYELRIYHTLRRKAGRSAATFSRSHHKTVREARDKERGVLDAYRRSTKGQNARLHPGSPQREAATANWQAFRDDPEWQSVRDKSEANGKIVEKVIPPLW